MASLRVPAPRRRAPRRGVPRRSAARAPLAAALAALALSLGAGCTSDLIDPVIDIDDRRMVVIPFRDEVQYHYRSARGNKLTQMLTHSLEGLHLEEPADAIAVVPFEQVVEAVGREEPTGIPHEEMAKRVKADCFLVGAITRFEAGLPGDFGIVRGRAEVALQVLDAARPFGRPLYEGRLAVSFPPDTLTSSGYLMSGEATPADIETGLYATLVDKIGKLFRYHEPEERR